MVNGINFLGNIKSIYQSSGSSYFNQKKILKKGRIIQTNQQLIDVELDLYNNDETLSEALHFEKNYNDNSVNNRRNICPSVWHLQSLQVWNILINAFVTEMIAGSKLKIKWLDHWSLFNAQATNESRFLVLPADVSRNETNKFLLC